MHTGSQVKRPFTTSGRSSSNQHYPSSQVGEAKGTDPRSQEGEPVRRTPTGAGLLAKRDHPAAATNLAGSHRAPLFHPGAVNGFVAGVWSGHSGKNDGHGRIATNWPQIHPAVGRPLMTTHGRQCHRTRKALLGRRRPAPRQLRPQVAQYSVPVLGLSSADADHKFSQAQAKSAKQSVALYLKLAHKGHAPLEQIQLSLGHASVQTTERYLGLEQDLVDAPCDHLGLRL